MPARIGHVNLNLKLLFFPLQEPSDLKGSLVKGYSNVRFIFCCGYGLAKWGSYHG